MTDKKSGYEEDKYAIENIREATGERVRLMECYGENAAKAVSERANQALPDGYHSEVIKL